MRRRKMPLRKHLEGSHRVDPYFTSFWENPSLKDMHADLHRADPMWDRHERRINQTQVDRPLALLFGGVMFLLGFLAAVAVHTVFYSAP